MIKYDYVKTERVDVQAFPERGMGAVRWFMKWATWFHVLVFRLSKGRLMTKFIGGQPVCIITTTGAKSGKIRRIALMHLPHGDNELMVASQGGMERHPQWYHNVTANPVVQIMVAGAEKTYDVRRVSDEEKAQLWPHLCSMYSDFDEYQARTDRNIPVFCCEPRN